MHIMANISRHRVKLCFPLSLFNVFNDESDQHQSPHKCLTVIDKIVSVDIVHISAPFKGKFEQKSICR